MILLICSFVQCGAACGGAASESGAGTRKKRLAQL